ncbi:hypothetical protein Tco_1478598, partial [Tanacetum coccineum]
LKEIHNFKQEGDATLYQAWERYNDLIYKCPTHDLNIHQKVNIFYKGLDTITHQLLDSQGPIPNKTPNQALEAIRTMADHSHKWHDGSNSRKVSSGSSDGIAAIANKLDSLGRDMKNLKENVHAIQIGCETCGGAHLDKECPLSEDVKSVKEVKYGEFGRSFPNNNKNNASMLVEVADMSKKAPMGKVENILVKIDMFVFPTGFVIIDMLGDPNETMILGEDMIMFDININIYNLTVHVEKLYMANYIQEEESFNPLEISEDIFTYDPPLCLEFKKYDHLYETDQNNEDTIVSEDV